MKLTKSLIIAVGQYFLNYQLSQKQLTGESFNSSSSGITTETWEKGRKWDKQADLDRITKALPKDMSYQACAGTFWFYRKTGPVLKIYNKTWPVGEIEKKKKA